MYDDVNVSGNLNVGGTARIRPPIGYASQTTDWTISPEEQWVDDLSTNVTITGPSTLWIVWRGRIYGQDHSGSCLNAHGYGYSKINVAGTGYPESNFAWETGGEGPTSEQGFVSTLLKMLVVQVILVQ